MGLFRLFGAKKPAAAAPPRGPRLEALEDRLVPATTAFEYRGVLYITGDATVNKVEIKDDGRHAAGTIRYRLDSSLSFEDDVRPWRRTATAIHSIIVNTHGNNDVVRYRLTDDLRSYVSRDLQVYAGDGNDIVWGEFRDVLQQNSSLRMIAHGGNGSDELAAFGFGDLGNGASLGLSFDGQAGNDSIYALMDNDVDLDKSATLWMNLWGGDGADYFDVEYEGDNHGRLLLHLEGGNHNDTADVRFFQGVNSTGTVGDPNAANDFQGNWNRYATVSGDAGDDDLEFQVWRGGFSDPDSRTLARLSGGSGTDRFTLTRTVALTGQSDPNEFATLIQA